MNGFFPQRGRTVALVAAVLWFVGLNVCAFGLLKETSLGGKSACCCTDHPAEKGSPSKAASGSCEKYKAQESSPASDAKARVMLAYTPVVEFISWDQIAGAFSQDPGSVRATTSPPGEISFAEVVLQHSLFSQAPPLC